MSLINIESNASPQPGIGLQADTPAVISPMRLMYWSVRRELWENRSIYIAPLAVASLLLVAYLIRLRHLPGEMRAAMAPPPIFIIDNYSSSPGEAILQPYSTASLQIMATTIIVAVFYCLDALHGERRDRSILFWKSLPVSDLTTVLSKASIPVIILPLLTLAVTAATQWIMFLLASAELLAHGQSVSALWTQVPLFQMWLMLLYHLVGIHGLFYAPFYGWLLLVSAWARRATFLWAGLPLLAIGIVEKIAFRTSHFADMIGSRLNGGAATGPADVSMSMASMIHVNVGQLLTSADLWIGLALFAIFIAGAVRLRRYQGPI